MPANTGKGVVKISQETLQQRRREAVELVKKGGLSAKIGLAFLKQHAAA
ncbi:hypothetical protein [Ruegeria lacuscaerulensis]|nr:hypothetical protein [Ruegeria lacuscaerulensis]